MSAKFFVILFSLLLIGGMFFQINPSFAQKTIDDAQKILSDVVKPSGIANTAVPTDLPSAVGFWVRTALTSVGIIFFVLMFYGGFLWLTARESEEKVTKAKGIITMAVIGMFIVIASYAISSFVSSRLIEPPSEESGAGSTTPDVSEGPKGCCVDWVSGETQMLGTGGLPACRITTYDDCQLQGSSPSEYDNLISEDGSGCWEFYEGEIDAQLCTDEHC